MTGGCDCSGTPKCSDTLSKEAIIKCRQECMELTKDELDLVVMSQIRSLRSNPDQPTSRSSHHSSVHSTYHNFRVNSSQPGTVFLRTYSDSDMTQCAILKQAFHLCLLACLKKQSFPLCHLSGHTKRTCPRKDN